MTESESGNVLQGGQSSAGNPSPFGLRTALAGISSFSAEASKFPSSVLHGKTRLSLCAGAFAGILVAAGFFLFDKTKEEWTLRQRYPQALDSAERYIFYCQDLLAEGEYEKAERILTGVLQESTQGATRAEALLLLPRLIERSRDDDASAARARELYQEFISNYPLDPRVSTARLCLAENFARNKYYIESNAELKSLLEATPDARTEAEIRFLIARNYYDAGAAPESTKLLQAMIQEFAGSSATRDAEVLLGRICWENGKKEDALKQLGSLVREAPGTFHAALALKLLAQSALEEKAYAQVIDNCNEWLASSPDGAGRANIMLLLGEARLGMKEPRRAVEAAEDVIMFFPDSSCAADAHILKGRALEHLDRIEDAEVAYQEAIDQFPGNTQAYKEVARLHRMRGDMPQAIRLIERVCSIDSGDDSALLELAKMYGENRENVKATQLLNRFIHDRQLSAQIGEAFLLLAQMQAEEGQLDGANRTLDRLLATETTTVAKHLVYERQGDLFAQAGLYDEAVETYELARENGAKSQIVSLKIARALLELGKAEAFQKEAALIAQASLAPAERYEFFSLLARAKVGTKDFASARRYVHDALSLKTGKENFSTLALLMRIDLALSDDAEAQKVYEVTRRLLPQEGAEAPSEARQIVLDWAEHLYGKQEYAKAADVYASVCRPWFPSVDVAWAICQEGNCHYHLADYAKAREAYSQLKTEFPDSEFAPFAAQREKLLDEIVKNSLRQT